MAAVTRLGLYGGPRGLYGDFSGKSAAEAFDPRVSFDGTPAGPAVVTGTPSGPAVVTGTPAGPAVITGDGSVDATNITAFYKGEPVEIQLFAKAPGGSNVIASAGSQVIKITVAATKAGTAILDYNDKYTLIDSPTAEFKIILTVANLSTLVEGITYYYYIWSQLSSDDPRLQKWGAITLVAAAEAA